AGPDTQVQPVDHDRRRHRGLGAVDHGREGAHRNPGSARHPGVPPRGVPRDPAGERRGRHVGARRGRRRAQAPLEPL
ncbi:MAG: Carbon storage regulator, partial [uncultured Solirubrobacteraceae bacterium]